MILVYDTFRKCQEDKAALRCTLIGCITFLMSTKKNPKAVRKKPQPSREDKQRTWAGKTMSSKVRSEGRAAAALERRSITKRIYLAEHGEG
jgi:hypothetical protein